MIMRMDLNKWILSALNNFKIMVCDLERAVSKNNVCIYQIFG